MLVIFEFSFFNAVLLAQVFICAQTACIIFIEIFVNRMGCSPTTAHEPKVTMTSGEHHLELYKVPQHLSVGQSDYTLWCICALSNNFRMSWSGVCQAECHQTITAMFQHPFKTFPKPSQFRLLMQ